MARVQTPALRKHLVWWPFNSAVVCAREKKVYVLFHGMTRLNITYKYEEFIMELQGKFCEIGSSDFDLNFTLQSIEISR